MASTVVLARASRPSSLALDMDKVVSKEFTAATSTAVVATSVFGLALLPRLRRRDNDLGERRFRRDDRTPVFFPEAERSEKDRNRLPARLLLLRTRSLFAFSLRLPILIPRNDRASLVPRLRPHEGRRKEDFETVLAVIVDDVIFVY